MEPRRIEHDPHHKTSSRKLGETSSMNKECASVRKLLRKHLHGHLFQLQKIKVERHLKSCVVCSSEYQALRQKSETRRLLKDITPPEGLVQHLKEGASGLAKLKKLLYRPLWLVAIAGVVVLVYLNVATRHRDVEIENLEKSLPPAREAPAPSMASAPSATPAAAAPRPASAAGPSPAPPASRPAPQAPAIKPLAVTVAAADEQEARQRINEAMRGPGALRNLRFSDDEKELAGSLPAGELLALFARIEPAGTVSYSRKRFASFPAAQPIPFVMTLRTAPKAVERPAAPAAQKAPQPAETAAQPASAPSQTTLP
jgi:hypothetical protein